MKEAGQDPIRERERLRTGKQARAGGAPTFEAMAPGRLSDFPGPLRPSEDFSARTKMTAQEAMMGTL